MSRSTFQGQSSLTSGSASSCSRAGHHLFQRSFAVEARHRRVQLEAWGSGHQHGASITRYATIGRERRHKYFCFTNSRHAARRFFREIAPARFAHCATFDDKRQFLVVHVERIIYDPVPGDGHRLRFHQNAIEQFARNRNALTCVLSSRRNQQINLAHNAVQEFSRKTDD